MISVKLAECIQLCPGAGRDLKGLREPMQASEDLCGSQRASEIHNRGLNGQENPQNGLGVFREVSKDLNLRLRGAEKASLGLEDG